MTAAMIADFDVESYLRWPGQDFSTRNTALCGTADGAIRWVHARGKLDLMPKGSRSRSAAPFRTLRSEAGGSRAARERGNPSRGATDRRLGHPHPGSLHGHVERFGHPERDSWGRPRLQSFLLRDWMALVHPEDRAAVAARFTKRSPKQEAPIRDRTSDRTQFG